MYKGTLKWLLIRNLCIYIYGKTLYRNIHSKAPHFGYHLSMTLSEIQCLLLNQKYTNIVVGFMVIMIGWLGGSVLIKVHL